MNGGHRQENIERVLLPLLIRKEEKAFADAQEMAKQISLNSPDQPIYVWASIHRGSLALNVQNEMPASLPSQSPPELITSWENGVEDGDD